MLVSLNFESANLYRY